MVVQLIGFHLAGGSFFRVDKWILIVAVFDQLAWGVLILQETHVLFPTRHRLINPHWWNHTIFWPSWVIAKLDVIFTEENGHLLFTWVNVVWHHEAVFNLAVGRLDAHLGIIDRNFKGLILDVWVCRVFLAVHNVNCIAALALILFAHQVLLLLLGARWWHLLSDQTSLAVALWTCAVINFLLVLFHLLTEGFLLSELLLIVSDQAGLGGCLHAVYHIFFALNELGAIDILSMEVLLGIKHLNGVDRWKLWLETEPGGQLWIVIIIVWSLVHSEALWLSVCSVGWVWG